MYKLRRVKILHNHLVKSYIAVAKLGDIQLELVILHKYEPFATKTYVSNTYLYRKPLIMRTTTTVVQLDNLLANFSQYF